MEQVASTAQTASVACVATQSAEYASSLSREEIELLAARREWFQNAYFNRPLTWWAESSLKLGRCLCVAEAARPTVCLGRFHRSDLESITDADDFQLRIITGDFDPHNA